MLRVRLVGDKQVAERFAQIVGQQHSVAARALTQAATMVQGEAKRQVYAGRPRHLMGDTGALRSSITTQVDQRTLRAVIGSPLVYAPVHEFGAVIRPKTKSYLVFFIPNERARATMSPVARRTASRRSGGKLGVWVRTKKVTIPERPYLGPALQTKRSAIEELFRRAIDKLLGGKP